MNHCLFIGCLMIAAIGSQVHEAAASNILGLFPHHGYSHFKVFYPIMRGLAERGHNVTVVTYIRSTDPPLPNYQELLLASDDVETMHSVTLDLFDWSRSLSMMTMEFGFLQIEGQKSCRAFFESGYIAEVQERHSRTPFDLVISEFFNTDCYLAVPYLLNVPVVGLSSCALMPWYYDRILLPQMPSHVQSEFIGFPEELNWKQRLVNFVQARLFNLMYRYHTNYLDQRLIREYLNVDLDVTAFAKRATSLILVNQHYSLSGNRPMTPQLIEVGGIHIKDRDISKPLPREINTFLEKVPADNKVLFISWGSMIVGSSIAKSKINAVVKVAQEQSLSVIWKWEGDEKPTQSEQFLFVKWAPQLALLCNPKVNFFWGHGGLLGTTEAAHCGKPLLVTPIYGDQFLNGAAVENRNIGRIVPYKNIDEQNLRNSLKEIMQNRYIENAVRLSNIFRNRENTPLNSSLWWIEHLLRHKAASDLLRTKAVHLNWFVYYSLDSVALLLAGAMAVLLTFYILIKMFKVLCCSRKKPKKKKNKSH